jgi:hypothetical protein
MADFGFIPNLVAGGDISPFRFVELSTTAAFTGTQANAAADTIVGVTDGSVKQFNATVNAAAGDQINLQPTNTVQIELGTGGATTGALLTSDANGKAVIGATGNACFYIALEAGVAGEIIRAFRFGTRLA